MCSTPVLRAMSDEELSPRATTSRGDPDRTNVSHELVHAEGHVKQTGRIETL